MTSARTISWVAPATSPFTPPKRRSARVIMPATERAVTTPRKDEGARWQDQEEGEDEDNCVEPVDRPGILVEGPVDPFPEWGAGNGDPGGSQAGEDLSREDGGRDRRDRGEGRKGDEGHRDAEADPSRPDGPVGEGGDPLLPAPVGHEAVAEVQEAVEVVKAGDEEGDGEGHGGCQGPGSDEKGNEGGDPPDHIAGKGIEPGVARELPEVHRLPQGEAGLELEEGESRFQDHSTHSV